MKTGRLSKAEKFYIEQNADTISVADLAKDLDRTQKAVEGHITNTKEKGKRSRVEKLMGKKTQGGRDVSVMTKGASEHSDDTRKNRKGKNRKIDGAIHKPKG